MGLLIIRYGSKFLDVFSVSLLQKTEQQETLFSGYYHGVTLPFFLRTVFLVYLHHRVKDLIYCNTNFNSRLRTGGDTICAKKRTNLGVEEVILVGRGWNRGSSQST